MNGYVRPINNKRRKLKILSFFSTLEESLEKIDIISITTELLIIKVPICPFITLVKYRCDRQEIAAKLIDSLLLNPNANFPNWYTAMKNKNRFIKV
jgi:hypothetical protein